MKKLKNIIIINDFDYVQGGASKVALETANILSDKYNVIFFSGDTKNDDSLNKKVIRYCTNQGEALKSKNKIKGFFNGIYNFKAYRELKKILNSLNNEETIIHVHGWTKCLSSSIFKIAWKMNFKVVLTMHDYFTACPNGGYFNYKKNEICPLKPMSIKCCKCNCDSRNYGFKLYRLLRQFVQNKVVKLNKRLTDVISISDFSEKILKKTLNKNTNIYRVYNPIDLDKKPQLIDYTKNDYYLYVGRVSPEKGVDLFCEAITNLNKKGIVVGDGPDFDKLKKEYSTINFVGWKSPEEVKKYMQGAKALIVPSRWYEGAPLTPLEALQYGIPIVSSDCNATIDYINNNNGCIFNIKYNNLAEILKNLPIDLKPNIPCKNNYFKKIVDVYNSIIK